MEIHNGTDRRVIVGNTHTIKFAHVSIGDFFNYARKVRRDRGVSGLVKLWRMSSVDSRGSLKGDLAHGLLANRRENRLASTGVVIPTTSILGGLINIQRTAQPIETDGREIHRIFTNELENNVALLSHTTDNASNFGHLNGQAYFVDGGSQGLEQIMAAQPETIHRSLGQLSVTEAVQ